MAYEAEYGPLGPERSDWQAALVSYMVAASAPTSKRRRFRLKDFLLRWNGRRERQSPAEQLALFRALASRSRVDDS